MSVSNPKIIHRIYFPEFRPFHDPFEHYMETWVREMPDYEIQVWNSSNLNVEANDWTRRAYAEAAPVYLSEYFRWQVLEEFGGLYLDADCEILNGKILKSLIDELYAQDDYHTFFGVEEKSNGHPTAQTLAAKKGSDLVRFMRDMYDQRLSGPLWHWREKRGFIGPQLLALYFLEKGINVSHDGFFKNLDEPVIACECKIYPQTYFSPKFTLLGDTLDFRQDQTCVYHMFANSNIDFSLKPRHEAARTRPLLFSEYREALNKATVFPRRYDASWMETRSGTYLGNQIVSEGNDGVLVYGPYISLPHGKYVVNFNFNFASDEGVIELRVTAGGGSEQLAHRSIQVTPTTETSLQIAFAIQSKIAHQVEFTASSTGLDHFGFESVDLDVAPAPIERPQSKSLKILHRIYFGFDGKPDAFGSYLETWKEQLPGFTIMNWNASNLPMDINDYVRNLYAERDHAFLTDYFRWFVLREHGGVYLDADVEVLKGPLFENLVEELEEASAFDALIGIDEASGGWYTAHSMVSKPGSAISIFMCDVYENLHSFVAWRKKGFYFWAPQLVALYFANAGHNTSGMGTSPGLSKPIVTARVKIYPQTWFSPISPSGNADEPFVINGLSEDTCLCHHFACSWHDESSIYVRHAKERGGQSGALLGSVLAESRVRRFAAQSAYLFSRSGERIDNKIVTTRQAGHLVFGPYVSLAKGQYRVSLGLSEVERWGHVRIEFTLDRGDTKLIERDVALNELTNGRIVQDIVLDKMCEGFESRLYVDDITSLAFTDLVIERTSELL